MDILFRTDEHVFSYRVAGISIHNGKILLQKPLMTHVSCADSDIF